MVEYPAELARLIDGDSMILIIEATWSLLPFIQSVRAKMPITVRLLGVNCHELSTPAGKAARTFTATWLANHGGRLIVETEKRDKYGRYLGTIRATDEPHSLNAALLTAGHAVPLNYAMQAEEEQ